MGVKILGGGFVGPDPPIVRRFSHLEQTDLGMSVSLDSIESQRKTAS